MTKKELKKLDREISIAKDRLEFTKINYPQDRDYWKGYFDALELFRLRCITDK